MVLLIGLAGSQRLKTSQTLIEQKNSEDCDVRLQKCDAGVDWQNVDVKRFSEHLGPVWSVAISPDGQTLASGGGINSIWNLPTGSCSTYYLVIQVGFMPLRLAPMGRPLAAVRINNQAVEPAYWRASKPFWSCRFSLVDLQARWADAC